MSNHRRAPGELPSFDYVPRTRRRHRYLDEDPADDRESGQEVEPGGTGHRAAGESEPEEASFAAAHHHSADVVDTEPEFTEPEFTEPEFTEPEFTEPEYDRESYPDVDSGEYAYQSSGTATAFDEAETQIIEAVSASTPAAEIPVESDSGVRRHRRSARGARRRKVLGFLAVATVLMVSVALVFVGGKVFSGPEAPADYTGSGGSAVVIQVHPGDTANEIATTLANRDVVASGSAFFNAAVQNSAMSSVQPGFYSLPTRIPAAEAVRQLVSPTSRVGQLIISEGRQLHDTTDVQTGAKKKGIYTLISEASCLGSGEQRQCISYEALDQAGAGDLSQLGVPDWAKESVGSVPDRSRQLEGLIAAGSWDFDPSSGPTAVLRRLVSESAASYEKTGILTAGGQVGLTPYQMLIAASLVEREAMPADFSKVARVIVNRLAINQPLQFDSTVNYALDTTELATTDADRARVTPWNTYASPGLPATPISSPSIGALQAVESPAPGDWIYFVTVDSKGTTLFTKSYQEHLSNINQALNNGILNSGR